MVGLTEDTAGPVVVPAAVPWCDIRGLTLRERLFTGLQPTAKGMY